MNTKKTRELSYSKTAKANITSLSALKISKRDKIAWIATAVSLVIILVVFWNKYGLQ